MVLSAAGGDGRVASGRWTPGRIYVQRPSQAAPAAKLDRERSRSGAVNLDPVGVERGRATFPAHGDRNDDAVTPRDGGRPWSRGLLFPRHEQPQDGIRRHAPRVGREPGLLGGRTLRPPGERGRCLGRTPPRQPPGAANVLGWPSGVLQGYPLSCPSASPRRCHAPLRIGDLAPPPQSRPPSTRAATSRRSWTTPPRSGTTPLPCGTSPLRFNRDLPASIATSPASIATSPRFNRDPLHHDGGRPPLQRSPSSAVHRRAPLRQSSCPPPVTRPPPIEWPPPPSRRSPPPRRRIPLSSRRTPPSRPGRPPPRLLLHLPPR